MMASSFKQDDLSIDRRLSTIVTTLSLVLLAGFMMACASSPSMRETDTMPISPWGDNYMYSYEPPETKSATSVKVTIAIVNPYYAENTLNPDYSKVANGLAKSLATDLDKIIVAKGMTVTGPYESLDMMTYPDKKNADLSLTPEFLINAQHRDLGGWTSRGAKLEKNIEVRLDGWVILVLREPLSSEKIWIKKIPVAELSERGTIIAEAVPVYARQGDIFPFGYNPGTVIYDGGKDAIANMIKQLYPSIMDTAWRYLNTQEILILKAKAKEIRTLKRY
jgi:hypothetical protein